MYLNGENMLLNQIFELSMVLNEKKFHELMEAHRQYLPQFSKYFKDEE